jgi:type 1 fimbria pilin
MKNIHYLFLAAVLMLICFGCSNDDDSADLASGVEGFYTGIWRVSGYNRSGTCEVIRVSDTKVKLEMEILGVGIPEMPDVKLSDSGDGIINLKYTDSSGILNGSIQGKLISVSIADGSTTISFSGTRP